MKKLGNEIQNIGLEHEFGELFREMLEDPDIVKLIEENNLTNEDIIKNDSMLVSYIISKEKCVGCKGVENCQQLNKGYSQSLFYEDDTFKLERKPCTYQQVILEEKAKAERLQVIGIDLSLYNDELFTNTNRKSVLAKVKQVIVNYQKGLDNKGFYLHGSYGSGKTYILANLAKILVSSNARVIFAYYPDLVRKIKGYIGKTCSKRRDTICSRILHRRYVVTPYYRCTWCLKSLLWRYNFIRQQRERECIGCREECSGRVWSCK
jgi:primosomal protein DnaI